MYREVLYQLNFTQFSKNRQLMMKYCSLKDRKFTSSCENVILHTNGEGIFIVTLKTNFPFKYFQKSLPSTVIYRLPFRSEVHGLDN